MTFLSFSSICLYSLKPHHLSLLKAQKMKNIKHKGSWLTNNSAEHKNLSVSKISCLFFFFTLSATQTSFYLVWAATQVTLLNFSATTGLPFSIVKLLWDFLSSPSCTSLGVSAVYPVSKVFLLLFRL